MKRFAFGLVALTVLVGGMQGDALGSPIIFTGSDDGAPVSGPFPNSSAAQASFLSAASVLGPVSTITFENQPVGYNPVFTAAPGVTVTLTGPNYGPGYSGISNTTFGNLYGFNITPGGQNWLGFPTGTATFNFANPTQSFGFWLTGVQTIFTSAISVTYSDGTSGTLNAPVNVNGGASYFGFTNAGDNIKSITISNISNDAWGIDDVSYNGPLSTTPEPGSLTLLGLCSLGVAGYSWRRRKQAVTA